MSPKKPWTASGDVERVKFASALFVCVALSVASACSSSSAEAPSPNPGGPGAVDPPADGGPGGGPDGGPTSDAGGCSTRSNASPPTTLVSLGAKAAGLATDGSFVFYTVNGALKKVGVEGGTPSVVGTAPKPDRVVLGTTHVFWSERNPGNDYARLWATPKDGGAPKLLASARTQEFAGAVVHGPYLYWFVGQFGPLMRVPTSSLDSPEELSRVAQTERVQELAIAGATAYYGRNTDSTAELVAIPLTVGATPKVVFSGVDNFVNAIVADSQRAYFADNTSIRAVDSSTGVVTTIAKGQEGPTGLALDGEELYWATIRDGGIHRARIDGSCNETLATGEAAPFAVAVDATRIFWLTEGTAQVAARVVSMTK